MENAKPLTQTTAGDIKTLAAQQTDPECREWCDQVGENNPPGQVLYADKAMLDQCLASPILGKKQ